MKAGVISENSVGILPLQKRMNGEYRELTEVKLFEISAVTLAANDQAMILDVKGNVDLEKVTKRYDKIAKLIRKGEISDELGFALEAEILKLKSIYVNATLPTVEVTEPEIVKTDTSEIVKYLYNRLNK